MFKIFFIVFALFATPILAEDIELSADNGLEWNQRELKITMYENAVAKTENYELKSDTMEALYKDNNKIYKIFATDNVTIDSATENITTDKLIYDINQEIITLISKTNPTYLKTGNSIIIAKDEVIYYKDKSYATAKNAQIHHSEREIFADDIKIDFTKTNEIKLINAKGNIKLIDGEEELYGDTAKYNPKTGMTIIEGNVYFKKGTQANLSGGKIIYNMNTGIANILPKEGDGKVKGVFTTDKK